MGTVADGVVPVTLGVAASEGVYDAHPGEAVFRAGRLVGLRIGDRYQRRPDGGPLTVGVTYFPGLDRGTAGSARRSAAGYVRWRGVSRAYAAGEAAGETDLGEVSVDVSRLAGG